MLKKIKIWFARFMMIGYARATLDLDRLIDWDKDILSRTVLDEIRIDAYRRCKQNRHKWWARYYNLLFGDCDWYTPIKE